MITPASITCIAHRTWRYTWVATTAPYRIVFRGLTIATVWTATYDYRGGDGVEPPVLEILDNNDIGLTPSQTYPPYAIVQWRGHQGASHYTVARNIAGVYVDQETIAETGFGYYTHVAAALPDATVAEFRVLAFDTRNTASEPVFLSANVIAVPDPPRVAIGCLNGSITVAER